MAFLVTDISDGGSDTLATSYISGRAIAAVEAKTGEKFDPDLLRQAGN